MMFALALLVLLAGCQDTSTQPASTTSAPTQPPQPAASSAASSPSAPVSASANLPAPSARPSTALPSVPTAASPRPTPQEWAAAPTIERASAVPACQLQLVREWLRASCGRDVINFQPNGTGRAGTDFFVNFVPASLEVRLRPGIFIHAQPQLQSGPVANFVVAWPEEDSQPALATILAPLPGKAGFFRISEPQSLPSIPTDRSPRPSPAQWVKAISINTAAQAQRAPGCEIHLLREWVRLQCAGIGGMSPELEKFKGLGTRDQDYFASSGFHLAQLEVRLQPGMMARAEVWTLSDSIRDFKVEWTKDAPAPSVVSVEKR